MRKHVIQFEIAVPDKMTKAELLAKMQAVLDLLEHKTSNVKLDPPPQRIPFPVPAPKDDQAPTPWIPPQRPYQPYKPYSPSIGDEPNVNPPWRAGDEFYRHYQDYKKKLDCKYPDFKAQLAKIDGLVK